MRILCVAEKNSIAKEVAHILSGGRTRKRDLTWKYVKNYDFSCNFPGVGQCNVTMTAVSGHILGTDFGPEYGWGKCPPGRLFEAPIIWRVTPDKDNRSKKISENISKEARNADKLMIWTDCDREGEYIGWEILHIASEKNRRLSHANTWRAQFSHLEPSHILSACENPKQLDMRLVAAVETRMEFDLRVGTSFTRFLTDTYRSKRLVDDGIVSYGTCQFPTLSFVVDRYIRVRNFTPEPFWFIDVTVAHDDRNVPFTWERGHIFDKAFVSIIYSRLLRFPDSAKISLVSTKPTSHFKPFPLTTVELQKCCSRYFKMSAKQALDAAELLYTSGYISYPRTETDSFPANMDLRSYVSKQKQDSGWGSYADKLVSQNAFRSPRGGKHDDKAHPPIYPVKYVAASALKGDQKKVYEFIVRRFLACCSDDARGFQTKAELQWESEKFTASGLQVTERNFLDVYTYTDWKSSVMLPEFTQGQRVKIHSAKLKEGKTSPPTYMTETELIALMDANGIGTDATIADHIDKIILRNYINRRKTGRNEFFIPTSLGISLIEAFDAILVDRISLSKPFLRRALEGFLVKISLGELSKQDVINQLLPLYKEAFVESNQKSQVMTQTFLDTNRRLDSGAL